jgi:hypothetical protein
MRPKYPKFTPAELNTRIDEYFTYIKGAYRNTRVPVKNAATKTVTKKVCDREPEPATITGLALFLGFNSLQDFDRYLQKGKLAKILSRARLRIQSVYEQKLHDHYASGPIFVLKNILGLNEIKSTDTADMPNTLNIKITDTGPQPAASEKEVIVEEIMPSIIQNIPMTNDQ